MLVRRLFPLVALGALCGVACAQVDEGEAFIQGVDPLVGPACVASANSAVFQASSLLDIGIDQGSANSLILPMQVATNLPSTFSSTDLQDAKTKSPSFPNYGNTDSNIITFTQSEVFFSTDEDRGNQLQLGQVAGTPVNRDNERLATVSGVVFNEQTQLLSTGVVFTTAISKGDAVSLQSEPFVAGALSAGGTAHIILNIRLKGTTTGGSTIETPVFPYPVDLCAGCLTTAPACADATGNPVQPKDNDAVCFRGVDEPLQVCP